MMASGPTAGPEFGAASVMAGEDDEVLVADAAGDAALGDADVGRVKAHVVHESQRLGGRGLEECRAVFVFAEGQGIRC
ncbi:MAG: hypothetical protein U1G05_10835 [Kiritimatiellia bacterium]